MERNEIVKFDLFNAKSLRFGLRDFAKLEVKLFNWLKKLFSKKRESHVIDMSDSIKLCDKIIEKIKPEGNGYVLKHCYKAEGYYDICSHCEHWKYTDKENKLGYCTNKDDKRFTFNTEKVTGCSKFQGTENYKRLVKTLDNALGLTNELRAYFRRMPDESN